MQSSSEYRIDVLSSFAMLKKALQFVLEKLCGLDGHLPVWFEPSSYFISEFNKSDREQVFNFINQLEYFDQQKPKEILIGAGIVASSAGTLEAIQHLNACKDRFKASILALKSAKIALSDPYLTEHFEKVLSKRARDVADTLTKKQKSYS